MAQVQYLVVFVGWLTTDYEGEGRGNLWKRKHRPGSATGPSPMPGELDLVEVCRRAAKKLSIEWASQQVHPDAERDLYDGKRLPSRTSPVKQLIPAVPACVTEMRRFWDKPFSHRVPVKGFSRLEKIYRSSALAVRALNATSMLTAYQAELMEEMGRQIDAGSPDSTLWEEICVIADLNLRSSRGAVQSCSRSMGLAVVGERALWLGLTGLSEREKVEFLDAPIEPKALFGAGVANMRQQCDLRKKNEAQVEASINLQEKICSEHDKVLEIYCRTDRSFICYLCMTDEHRSHDTVSVKAYRTEQQTELKEEQMKFQQRIQEKQKKVQELKQAVNIIKLSAQTAVDDSGKIFTEMISSMEKKRSEVTELIRDQEKAELSRAERLLEQLEQEISDLQRRITELEQLSHTHDHIHFLQEVKVLVSRHQSPKTERPNVPADVCEDSLSITVNIFFDAVRKSLSDLKKRLEEFCQEKFIKIREHKATVSITLVGGEPGCPLPGREDPCWEKFPKEVPRGGPPGLRTMVCPAAERRPGGDGLHPGELSPELPGTAEWGERHTVSASAMSVPWRPAQEGLDFCDLTLDPNTVDYYLILSEKNKVVTLSETKQPYSDHPERFNFYSQVLSKESVCERCYWEVEWSSESIIFISISYKDIRRKGQGDDCVFGHNNQSWSLQCSSSSVYFWHNKVKTDLKVPSSSRIGVYVDHNAGTPPQTPHHIHSTSIRWILVLHL
ncbi:E3 ubiquitin/ISG15 ligase TRIM25-like [Silurus meridionalis]|nr:E3 ubiquitin/ISG15 ligase TRIM25-like [Silurus meridionalis]